MAVISIFVAIHPAKFNFSFRGLDVLAQGNPLEEN